MSLGALEQDFATKHPSAFANVISALSIADSLEVITSLRSETVFDVLNFLTASHLLAIAPITITPDVIAATRFEKSLPVLLRLPRDLMHDLTKQLTDEKLRTRYRQALRLSTGTVATTVKPASMICDAQTPISDLSQLIRQSTDEPRDLGFGSEVDLPL